MKRLISYIKDDSFQFRYINGSINIVNFLEIKTMTDNLISLLDKNNHLMIIKGENLVLKKMISNEVLISGLIKSIEM